MDTVTLNEEEGEETFGDEDRAFELVTRTHKNPHYSKVYRRNTRDRLHVKTGRADHYCRGHDVSYAKLMGSTEESMSGVTDHRRSHETSRGEQYSRFLFSASRLPETGDDTCLQGERQAT